MTEGLILLGFLAVLVALFVVRTRRRLGLASTGKTWAVIIAVFVVFVLGLWASARTDRAARLRTRPDPEPAGPASAPVSAVWAVSCRGRLP